MTSRRKKLLVLALLLLPAFLGGCTAADVTLEILDKIIDWREFAFLSFENNEILEVVVRKLAVVMVIALLLWFIHAVAKQQEISTYFKILAIISLLPYTLEFLKLIGQWFWLPDFGPAWVKDMVHPDSTSALILTLAIPIIHLAMEIILIVHLIYSTFLSSVSYNTERMLGAIASMFGWAITPILEFGAIWLVNEITTVHISVLLVDIETQLPNDTVYFWVLIATMILGYFGVPIYMTAKGPFKRLREARERTESKRANRELQQALETAVSAIGGAVAGAVVARSGPDPLPPSSNGPTGPGYSFRVVPPWEGPSVIYGQPHRYPRSAQIDAPGVVEGQVRPIIDDPTRQLPDPSQPPGNSGTAGGSPGRNPSGGVPKTLNTAEFFEDLRRRRQANQNQSQSPSASAADSEPPVIQINSRQLIREQTQPPPPAQKREIDKGKVAGITAGGLKILGIGAGAVHPLLGTATNLVATGFEGYANKKAANQKAAESTQSEGVPKTLTLQQMYELLRQQKGGQSRA